MRKIIILSAATLILSSCGIYNKYKPVSEVPEGLYGSESVAATDTANFGNLSSVSYTHLTLPTTSRV